MRGSATEMVVASRATIRVSTAKEMKANQRRGVGLKFAEAFVVALPLPGVTEADGPGWREADAAGGF